MKASHTVCFGYKVYTKKLFEEKVFYKEKIKT